MGERCPNSWCGRSFENRKELFFHSRNCRRTLRVLSVAAPQQQSIAEVALQQHSSWAPNSADSSIPDTNMPVANGTFDDYEMQHLAFMEECHQACEDSAPSALGFTAEVMTFLMRALSGKKFTELLQLFKQHGWEDLHIPEELRTARAWHLALRRGIAEFDKFEHIDIAAECGIAGECLILSIRKDLPGALKHMITEGPGSLHFWASKAFTADGERLFNALWNGDRWIDLEAYFREQRLEPKEWGLLMLIIWSDATWLDGAGRHSAHAVTASFGNHDISHLQSDKGAKHIAFLPVPVTSPDAPKSSEEYREKKRAVLTYCLGLIKERLLPLMERPFDIRVPDTFGPDASSTPHGVKWPWLVCRLVLACYQADLVELWSVLHMLQNGNFADIKYLVSKSEFASFEKFASAESLVDKRRTEEHTLQILEAAQDAENARRHLTRAKQLLKDHGLSTSQPDYNGMSKHLCEALELVIDKSWSENEAQLRKAEIDDRLSDMRHAFQARVPMQGLHAPKINGEERKGIMKVLPNAVNGIVPNAVVRVLADYQRLQCVRDAKVHTESELVALKSLIIRVGTDIVAVFSSIDKSWAFTKMFHMLRYPEDIRAYGTLVIGNTGPREQQNKLIKRAAQKTRLGCDGFTAKIAEAMDVLSSSQCTDLQDSRNSLQSEDANWEQLPARNSLALMHDTNLVSWRGRKLYMHAPSLAGRWFVGEMAAIEPAFSSLPHLVEDYLLSKDTRFARSPPQVIIKAMLTVPQRDGSLHLVRGHPALTKRNLQTSKLMDVCYKEENGARTQAYGQVLAVFTVIAEDPTGDMGAGWETGLDLIFLHQYDIIRGDKGAVKLPTVRWSCGQAGQHVYSVIDVSAVVGRVTILKDYTRPGGFRLHKRMSR